VASEPSAKLPRELSCWLHSGAAAGVPVGGELETGLDIELGTKDRVELQCHDRLEEDLRIEFSLNAPRWVRGVEQEALLADNGPIPVPVRVICRSAADHRVSGETGCEIGRCLRFSDEARVEIRAYFNYHGDGADHAPDVLP